MTDPGPRRLRELLCQLATGVSMINEPARRRVTGADVLGTLAEAVPVDVFGMGTEEPGAPLRGLGDVPAPAPHDEITRHRVYLHTARRTSLGLSLLEAMHLAIPVVVFAATEAVEVPADVSVPARGFREPGFSALAGENAREHACGHHGPAAFLTTGDHLLAETAS